MSRDEHIRFTGQSASNRTAMLSLPLDRFSRIDGVECLPEMQVDHVAVEADMSVGIESCESARVPAADGLMKKMFIIGRGRWHLRSVEIMTPKRCVADGRIGCLQVGGDFSE